MPFLNINNKLIDFSNPRVMGIINCTPDSFYDGNTAIDYNFLQQKISNLIAQGADIIDVGGQSTKPSATLIDAQTEWLRIEPILNFIKQNYPNQIISVDTFYASVAQKALEMGVSIINDISGFSIDNQILNVVAQYKATYILMHIKGTPENMQSQAHYENVVTEITQYFIEKLEIIKNHNIQNVILDLGFGFAKNIKQNFELLNHIDYFVQLFEKPLLVGISRKSMIYKTLHIEPSDALNGTTVLNTKAIMKGAHILRVHDVAEAKQVLQLCAL